jgi:hypothetical protein
MGQSALVPQGGEASRSHCRGMIQFYLEIESAEKFLMPLPLGFLLGYSIFI